MQYKYAEIADTVYFWFAANDTTGTAADGATPLYDVRLAGAAAGAAPTASGTPTLLSHADYAAGIYEIAIDTTGYAAGEYAVFCTLTVSTVNPSGFCGSFKLRASGTGAVGVNLSTQAKADVNAEVDAALNTAIPGSPTADSINERIVAIDGLSAPPTLAQIEASTVIAKEASVTGVDTVVDAIKVVTDKINDTLELDATVYRFTQNALEQVVGSVGSGDWSTGEKEQIRHRIGIDGYATAPTTGTPSLAKPGDQMDLVNAPNTTALQAIFGVLTSTLTVTGSIGKKIKDYVGSVIN